MKKCMVSAVAACAFAAGAPAQVVIDFDFYPGPDGVLGTPDDVPISAPTLFSDQLEQLTDQFESLGILFTPDPPIDDKNEILDAASFSTPPDHTPPNILASQGNRTIEFEFTVPVTEVGAIIGISGGSDLMEAFDAGGGLIDSVVGDDNFVSIVSNEPIARVVISPVGSTTPAIDNLTFEGAPACPADLDGDGDADVNDFFLFLDLFEAGDDRADITGDGTIDVNDFFAYLDLFERGC